jgi:hypothetical protein
MVQAKIYIKNKGLQVTFYTKIFIAIKYNFIGKRLKQIQAFAFIAGATKKKKCSVSV